MTETYYERNPQKILEEHGFLILGSKRPYRSGQAIQIGDSGSILKKGSILSVIGRATEAEVSSYEEKYNLSFTSWRYRYKVTAE